MVCNLAVTITKAAITNEQLLALISPAIAAETIKAAMDVLGVRVNPRISGTTVYAYAETSYSDQIQITYQGGKLTVAASTDARGEEITATITGGLVAVGDALFANVVAATLQQFTGKRPTVTTAAVRDEGVVYQANVFTVKI